MVLARRRGSILDRPLGGLDLFPPLIPVPPFSKFYFNTSARVRVVSSSYSHSKLFFKRRNTVSPRSQVRFQVQPQCTIAVKPVFPLPEADGESDGARRKDFLFTVNSPAERHEGNYNLKFKGAADMSRYEFKGQVIATVQQINVFLHKIGVEGDDGRGGDQTNTIKFDSALETHMYEQFKRRADQLSSFPKAEGSVLKATRTPSIIADVFRPLGVYNSRMTHNNMEAMAVPAMNNISNILGVNISN